jgi:hypothetical protein
MFGMFVCTAICMYSSTRKVYDVTPRIIIAGMISPHVTIATQQHVCMRVCT